MNSLLLALTALAILILSALFAAPLFINWNDYRPVFEAQATKLLGREVKVDGEVHMVLLPSPELRFDDVKVADEAGRLDRPFLEARSIEAWLSIGSLLSGTLEARKIAIVDPVLRLDLKKDGSGNWRDVGRPGVAVPFAPKELLIDSVVVSGGTIELSKQGVPQLTITGVEGDANAASLLGPYKVSAGYTYEDRVQELRFSTNQADAEGLFRLKAALRDPQRDTSYTLDGIVGGLGGKPTFDGDVVMRISNAEVEEVAADLEPTEPDPSAAPTPASAPGDGKSFFELKGPLAVTPDRAELPDFDLTIHVKGRPQILKGKLALDLGERLKTTGELKARFVDLDALFGIPEAEQRLSPAAVLYMLADTALTKTSALGEMTFAVAMEQASLGGDLLTGLDIALATGEGGMTLERLKATLPGENRIEVSGKLSHGEFGPVFAGPLKLKGAGLRTLSRWAAGARDLSNQASIGDFTLAANATVGDGAIKLADAQGELSGTKFSGALTYQGGERNLLELTLHSDRLDLREMIGAGPIWRSWLPATDKVERAGAAADDATQSLLAQFRNDDLRVSLDVGELLLPDIPAGRLDARFTVIRDTLDVEKLDFAATDELTLTGKGRIERLSESPSGGVEFALKATTTDSLRITSEFLGLPESVSKSTHLSSLVPVDIRVGLVAAREEDATKATLNLAGQAGGSAVRLVASAAGEPAKLRAAEIDVDGTVSGERPEALLVLLLPELPHERFASARGTKGKLLVKLKGVPNASVSGQVALETSTMQLAFDGEGALEDDGPTLTGHGSLATQDASLALMLVGLEAPPSAANVPLSVTADVVKTGGSLDINGIAGAIGSEPMQGSAHFDLSGEKTRFSVSASAGTVSLPALLGTLVAWQRAPAKETLGALGAGASEVWPSRGFALGMLEKAEGEIRFDAKTLTLGSALPLSEATLTARIDKDGLAVEDLQGRLFGGVFAASGRLAPRGAGAELKAEAELKGAKLEEALKDLTGNGVAKGAFDVAFTVQGEGLSPPGLVAGLHGDGSLSLGAGALQSLSSEPLRRFAAGASRKHASADKVAAEAGVVRETLTKGVYRYPPAKFAFEVKNGTLRLAPAALQGAGAETKINAYVELASLKLDSEWAMKLAGHAHQDFPPVSLLFTGSLDRAGDIAPRIDTAAIEKHVTMLRMQDDVERLETLDVSGRTAPAEGPSIEDTPIQEAATVEAEPEAAPAVAPDSHAAAEPAPESQAAAEPEPEAQAAAQPEPEAQTAAEAEPEPETASGAEPEPAATLDPPVVPAPTAEHAPDQAPDDVPTLQVAPSATAVASPDEALPMPVPNAQRAQGTEHAATPSAPLASPDFDAAASPEPPPLLAVPPAAVSDVGPQPTAEEAVAPPRASHRPRRPVRREAPDAWKKGIGIFGGG